MNITHRFVLRARVARLTAALFNSWFPVIKKISGLAAIIGLTASASAQMQITEWMYSGANGEFAEFTNVGATSVDMTGWSYSDSGRTAGDVSLSAFGLVLPGKSVILTETAAATFRTAWNLDASVQIIGGNSKDNLGRDDEINLYDSTNTLIDRLTFGDDVNAPGSPRTQNASVSIPLNGLSFTTAQTNWQLATVGDSFLSHKSTGNDIGNPGVYTPIG